MKEAQPDDSSYDEILRELAFARMIVRRLADSWANRTISNDEMKEKIRSWQRQIGRSASLTTVNLPFADKKENLK